MTKPKPKPKAKPPEVPKVATKAVPCAPCDGTGEVQVRRQTFGVNGDAEDRAEKLRCLRCGGSGKWRE